MNISEDFSLPGPMACPPFKQYVRPKVITIQLDGNKTIDLGIDYFTNPETVAVGCKARINQDYTWQIRKNSQLQDLWDKVHLEFSVVNID